MLGYLPTLLQGLPTSLSLTFCSLALALLLALLFTLLLTLKTPILDSLIKGYVTLFTGTPLLVQLFLIYYGLGQLPWIKQQPWLWQLFSHPWFCAMLGFALNSAAYSTLLFHGAVKAIPAGQWQACYALGMSRFGCVKVLLPYAVKRSLSAYSNEIILIFKSTSLAYTITLMDIMGYSQSIYGNNYDLNVYLAAGLIYLVINGLLTIMLRLVERKALRFEQMS